MSPRRAWADKMTRLELERLQVSTAPFSAPDPITPEQAAYNATVLLAGLSDDPAKRVWADVQTGVLHHA